MRLTKKTRDILLNNVLQAINSAKEKGIYKGTELHFRAITNTLWQNLSDNPNAKKCKKPVNTKLPPNRILRKDQSCLSLWDIHGFNVKIVYDERDPNLTHFELLYDRKLPEGLTMADY